MKLKSWIWVSIPSFFVLTSCGVYGPPLPPLEEPVPPPTSVESVAKPSPSPEPSASPSLSPKKRKLGKSKNAASHTQTSEN